MKKKRKLHKGNLPIIFENGEEASAREGFQLIRVMTKRNRVTPMDLIWKEVPSG